MNKLQKMISEKPVVIFSKNSYCMSHTIKTLFLDLGLNPTIYELDEINRGKEMEQALAAARPGGVHRREARWWCQSSYESPSQSFSHSNA